jgi:predicted ATP-grasp superfamily ATP-dependent carboligase
MLSRPEITIDAFRAADGAFFRCACRERVEVKAGVCTKARVHDDPELLALARAIADRLPLRGTFCVQVMRDAAGAWRVTDINARPGAGTRLSAAVGLDFLCATLVDAWGGDARPLLPPLGRERWVVRAYVEYVMR